MTPFTYLIGWSHLDKWYYGVRYAKGCEPDSLWKTYFTSSGIVKRYRKEYGEPDVIEIRRTFLSKTDALLWEEKVIRRLGALESERWMNKGNSGRAFYNSGGYTLEEKTRKRISENNGARKRKGKSYEEIFGEEKGNALREQRSEILRRRVRRLETYIKYSQTRTGMPCAEETKRKISLSQIGKTPWNKGLTKETDPRVMVQAESSKHPKRINK